MASGWVSSRVPACTVCVRVWVAIGRLPLFCGARALLALAYGQRQRMYPGGSKPSTTEDDIDERTRLLGVIHRLRSGPDQGRPQLAEPPCNALMGACDGSCVRTVTAQSYLSIHVVRYL